MLGFYIVVRAIIPLFRNSFSSEGRCPAGYDVTCKSLLETDFILEISALKACNYLVPHRLAAILHTDVSILLGSYNGKL